MANIWDPQRNVWVDDQTGNTFNPNVGVWQSPQGMQYVNGQWVQPEQPQQMQVSQISGTPGTSYTPIGGSVNPLQSAVAQSGPNGTFQAIPGYGYTVNTQQNEAASALAGQNNAASLQQEQMREQSAQTISGLQSQVQEEIAKGNNASAERIAQLNYQISQEQNNIALMNAQTNQANQAMQERQLQANLAANPQDFVAYEYYKRALGNPSTLSAVSAQGGVPAPADPTATTSGSPVTSNSGAYWSNGSNEGSVSSDGKWIIQNGAVVANPNSSASQVATPGSAPTGQMLNGQSYSATPPAYSDPTLANVGNSIQQGNQPQWNPQLSGTGAFGTQIQAPNDISRNTYGNLSPSEQAIMQSFLNAGVNMGGKQVSIDPTDYLAQMQKSWVPTLQGGTSQNTQYQE